MSGAFARTAKNALAAVAAVVLLALVLEVALRATHAFNARVSWVEPDTLIGWRFTPGREYWYHAENDHPITGRINSHGWRDVEREVVARDGVFRVAVLGDSFVEAFQIELDSTFVSLCERRLRDAGYPVEVMNFGRSGMTQSEELLVLRRDVLRFRPDLVVVVFVPSNDVADLHPATTINPLRPFFHERGDALELDTGFNRERAFRLKRMVSPLKQRSALVSLVTERVNAARQRNRQADVSGRGASASGLGGAMSLCTASPAPRFRANYTLAKRLLAEMARECGRGRFAVVSIDVEYRPERLASMRGADPTFDAGFFESDLARWGATRGVSVVGLQDAFAAAYAGTGRPLRWAHWNYAGHRLVAARLAGLIAGRIDSLEPHRE